MKRSWSAPDVACVVVALPSYLASFVFYLLGPRAAEGVETALIAYAALLAAASLVTVVEALARASRHYLPAIGFRVALSLAALSMSANRPGAGWPILIALLVPISLHNPYPWNVVIGLSVEALGLLTVVATLLAQGVDGGAIIGPAVDVSLAAAAIVIATSMVVRYRERLIEEMKENGVLHEVVDRLTRLNLTYQEYARVVQETSTEEERKRIISEIHDIVGYTLANTITLMEAITDMMRENPLGVASLVRSGRENAKEGMDRVRGALYQLRGKAVEYPTGWRGLQRLVAVFERSTGVKVELVRNDPGLVWRDGGPSDEAIYHVVQGSLLNAFRHGKATNVRVFITREGDRLWLRVRDNGRSAGLGPVTEGIGLSGMRERVQRLGGEFTAGTAPGGFEVTALIPVAAEVLEHG